MIDFETYQKILTDMGTGAPARGYTEEMLEARVRMEAEFDRFKDDNPDAYIHVPANLEGIPGSEPEKPKRADALRVAFLSPDEPAQAKADAASVGRGGKWWVLSEDGTRAIAGPFDTKLDAVDHYRKL